MDTNLENLNEGRKDKTEHNRYDLSKEIDISNLILHENLTSLDLSSRNIEDFTESMKLPHSIIQLNLSHNKLKEVPEVVLNLINLKILNISHNLIQHFDSVPKFCACIEELDISNNNLQGPPNWVWAQRTDNLTKLQLSNNINITDSFTDGYYEELLNYSTQVTEAYLENCKISKFLEFFHTFPKVKRLIIGTDINKYTFNCFLELPCKGLDKFCDLERLNVSNSSIYTMNPTIEMYNNLIEINLSHNVLSGLPKEFGNLENLEICVLSANKLLYLPEEMSKLKKLTRLYLDSNELCMFPDILSELPNLKTLDLYDNHLNDFSENYELLSEIDLAHNYFEEPSNAIYEKRKEKLRLVHENRLDGSKSVIERSDTEDTSIDTEDDEEIYEIFHCDKKKEEIPIPQRESTSSPEDWDSDKYWVPCSSAPIFRTRQETWLHFVKRKMAEGNFCPMDAHVVSVAEIVRYQRLCNPQVVYESDGQFDDYSSDET